MKRCTQCGREYDASMMFCLDDGAELLYGPASDEPQTAILPSTADNSEAATRAQVLATDKTAVLPSGSLPIEKTKTLDKRLILVPFTLAVVVLGGFFGYRYLIQEKQIESIAVMPFVNDSGDSEVEYLSDGMTETLISSLQQIPDLNVKARSTIFRYKGRDTDAKTIGRELNVQAILNGRVVQRGQELILYVELVDTETENSLWKQAYNKTMTNLVSLQNDVARDVADKLKVKLSGSDQQKLAKNYTENAAANQLYLRGRFHVFKLTPPEVHKGISYFQQAIEIDPNYALAYAGIADAYRSLGLGVEMPPSEVLPKSRAAAEKAIEIDDSISEGHTTLGATLFWEWNFGESEKQFKRALELNPRSADAHLFYAHLLSNMGRHTEALAEVQLAREIDPLSPYGNALEGQFLLHAGRPDEALDHLQKTFELAPNFWMPHLFASAAYAEKGMYAEAIVEARKARELSPVLTISIAVESYALAKAGRLDEARSARDELLQLSATRFVPPYHIAIAHIGLGEVDKTFESLRKAYEVGDPKMTFLKVEPKWKDLRDDSRFKELLGKIGFPK
jgi:TolB-like protein/Tfp pilus assembly protein PilF